MTRVLAIGRGAPWLGPRSGGAIRRAALLRGAARVGRLDYVALSPTHDGSPAPPSEVHDVVHVPTTTRPTGARGHLAWQVRAALHADAAPYELTRVAVADPGRARVTIEQLCDAHDVVWFVDRLAAFLTGDVARAVSRPSIVDVEEVVGPRDRQQAALLRVRSSKSWGDRVRTRAQIAFLERNARAWDDWGPRLGALATMCTVSNPGEIGALAGVDTTVVPNGCDVPPKAAPRAAHTSCPVLLFHGHLGYEPNADAAEHLVRDVVPVLGGALDGRDFEVRIVGRSTPAVEALARLDPRVTVTGYVDDIGTELDRADAVVVPLRMGSGTRLKILEAMAACTPVVSTTVGCDGLDVVDAEHLLVADAPVAFARACARVVDDALLRAHLVDHAYELVAARYDWRAIEDQVAALTRARVAAP